MSMKDISIGRRKASVARVRFVKGKGKIFVNNREPLEYFKRESLVMDFKQPLSLVDFDNKSDIVVNVNGGGLSGQAGAVRLGIARTLEAMNPDCRSKLKKADMLTRDSRVVERQKPGQPGARKKFHLLTGWP
jgi:small subunit ribosomal protein S9